MSVAGGRNNLIQLMEAEKGTHVDIAHPLPVWVLDRGTSADALALPDETADAAAGMKRERSASDGTPLSCTSIEGDMDDSVGSEGPVSLVRRDPLKAIYFIGLSLKDECKVCRPGTPSPGSFFKCPIKGSIPVLLCFWIAHLMALFLQRIFQDRAKKLKCPSKVPLLTGHACSVAKNTADTI
jgi:hypothetical protein